MMNVHQRINEVRKAIGYVQKDKAVSTGGGSYKATTHDAVTGLIRASLIENGVLIVPSITSCVFHPKEPDAKQRLYEAMYEIAFINVDDPIDRIVTSQSAHALDNGDKAPGKAQSYATKYAMLKMFSIETGDEEESRYQQDDAIETFIESIKSAETMEALQAVFVEANSVAVSLRDKEAQRRFIVEKDKRKTELKKGTEK